MKSAVAHWGVAWMLTTASVSAADPVLSPPYKAPSLSESSHAPLPPMVIPISATTVDRRPVWVGGGLVLVAAGLWWNQRRRDRINAKRVD